MKTSSKSALKFSFTAISALLLTGCTHGGMVSHTTHDERTTQAQEGTEMLLKRYHQLNQETLQIVHLNCASVTKADKKADKALRRLRANAVHPHEGQSVMHIPSHLEIQNAKEDLDGLSAAIAECQTQSKKEKA